MPRSKLAKWLQISSFTLVGLFACLCVAGAQGVRPLSDTSLSDVAAAAEGGKDPVYSPMLIAMESIGAGADPMPVINAYKRAPFHFYIETPYTRAVATLMQAKRKFEQTPTLDVAALNKDQVVLRVTPSDTINMADAIENVVIKRGAEVIRPLAKDVHPVTLQNRMGATFQLAEGTFTFPLETFDPTVPITFVLIGAKGNFEWTMEPAHLKALR